MIYSYEECMNIFDNFSNTIIKENCPIGYTNLEKIPIRHFTLGTGNNHIVVTASQHSNEIITTTFIIELMKYLITNNITFEELTIHFIPILNPEGYIVNTSAIRSKLSKDTSLDNTIKFCYDFYRRYKFDKLYKENNIKLHQHLFRDTSYKCIDKKYQILTDSVQEILSIHPKGSIIDWASNGNGIDLNSNSKNKIVIPNQYNSQNQYNNIRMDIPSPIGHPGKNNIPDFKEEIEITSLKKLLHTLNKDNKLLGYLNYHSTGGIIYQRPEDSNNLFSITYNYLLSKFYQEYTIKNEGKYGIITTSANKITSVNDKLRIEYIGNLLIELSPMMGNPLGVFGDYNNYHKTIKSNINSFIYTMNNIKTIYDISKQITQSSKTLDKIYPNIEKEYDNIRKRILTK